jgi:hypothetical protein
MNGSRPILKWPEVPEEELTPLVKERVCVLGDPQEYIRVLEDEIRRLKGGLGSRSCGRARWTSRPPRRGKGRRRGAADRGVRRPRSGSFTKSVGSPPPGSRFKGYRPYVVQDLEVRSHNIRFLLEHGQRPEGGFLTAEGPGAGRGGHFGPTLVSFVLYQYHPHHVTQPLLHQHVLDLEVEISAGQLNARVTEGHEGFHDEKADLKAAGLAVSC